MLTTIKNFFLKKEIAVKKKEEAQPELPVIQPTVPKCEVLSVEIYPVADTCMCNSGSASTYIAQPRSTDVTAKFTSITVKSDAICDSSDADTSWLPSEFKVCIPKDMISVVGFGRRAMYLLDNQCKYDNGMFYMVVAAPIVKSVALAARTCTKKQPRAVFIIRGTKLYYRLELVSYNKDKTEAAVEHYTYDISELISFYGSNITTSVTFY